MLLNSDFIERDGLFIPLWSVKYEKEDGKAVPDTAALFFSSAQQIVLEPGECVWVQLSTR